MSVIEHLKETTKYIQSQYSATPLTGIVLGSGLGNFIGQLNVEKEIEYDQIPHFPVSTVEGHHGKLIFADLNGKKIVAMSGRFHFYEGYSAAEVAYPIRVMKFLGIQSLLISNAAGGVNPELKVGDLMIIEDQISLFTSNPLLGPNEPELGPRFPDMSQPYSKELIKKAFNIGKELKLVLKKGVYAGVTGPTFETRSEYKMLYTLGADAVGMSTVQEVIVARHMNLPVFAMSVITDIGIRDEDNIITHEEVLLAASEAEPKLTSIFTRLIAQL